MSQTGKEYASNIEKITTGRHLLGNNIRYNRMLGYNKRHHLVKKIDEANKDSKQLFRALNSILGNKDENPLPTGTTNSQLAEDFAF